MKVAKVFLISLALIFTSCAGGQRMPIKNWQSTAENTTNSIVLIESRFEYLDVETGKTFKAAGIGSGVILSEDGWLITNAHVVTDDEYQLANSVIVKLFSGEKYLASDIHLFIDQDLAVMKISAKNLRFVKIRTTPAILGEPCLAAGNPVPYQFVAKEGIISQPLLNPYFFSWNGSWSGNDEEQEELEFGIPMLLVVHSATIHSGNSGGPLVDANGYLLGINEAIIPRKFIYGLAISSETVLQALKIVSKQVDRKFWTTVR